MGVFKQYIDQLKQEAKDAAKLPEIANGFDLMVCAFPASLKKFIRWQRRVLIRERDWKRAR